MDEDQQTVTALRGAVDTAARERHLDAGAARRAWTAGQAGRAPRRSGRTWLAVAATIVGVGGGATALATWSHDDEPTAPGGSACAGAVSDSALPAWARDGFSSGNAPHITGARGEIVGVLFADPLRVRPPAGQHNKVLWVARDPGRGPLTIRATLEGTRVTAVRTVTGGPGPSYLDLPQPGCWTLVLSWSGHRDTAAVPYSP